MNVSCKDKHDQVHSISDAVLKSKYCNSGICKHMFSWWIISIGHCCCCQCTNSEFYSVFSKTVASKQVEMHFFTFSNPLIIKIS